VSALASLLIVESNRHMRALLQRFLTRQQVLVHTATNPEEARHLLMQQYYPVVLTDIFLPHGTGRELLRYVRQTTPRTRVVMMTAFGSPELHQRLQEEGAFACIHKPFSLWRLWELLQQAFKAERTAAE